MQMIELQLRKSYDILALVSACGDESVLFANVGGELQTEQPPGRWRLITTGNSTFRSLWAASLYQLRLALPLIRAGTSRFSKMTRAAFSSPSMGNWY